MDSTSTPDGWRALDLADLPVIAPFYACLDRPLADMNVVMMAAWREVLGLRYRIEDGVLYMLGTFEGRTTLWGPPLGEGLALAHIRRGLDLCVAAGGEAGLRYLWRGHPLWSAATESKDYRVEPQATEYVYGTAAVASLAGSGFAKLRQSAACFERRFAPRVEPLSADNRRDCLELLDDWTEGKRARLEPAHREKFELERRVCRRALEDEVGIEGVVARSDGRVAAFSVGAPHGRDGSFNCMFEKTRPRHPGAAAFVFRALARSLAGRYDEINAGEDWNVDYLAAAKRKWQPARMERSFALHGG